MNASETSKKQLKIWKDKNKEYKKSYKQGWSMADPKKRPGVTKITGIKFADSKYWKLKSKQNLYKIKKINYIEWYKNVNKKDSHVTILGAFNFINAKNNNFISNTFPTTNKGTILEVIYGNDCKQIFVKEMGFGNMNKCVLPSANTKTIKKDGCIQVEWCALAVFKCVYIKVGEFYLKFRRGSSDETQTLPQMVMDDERNGKNTFHFGVGYCKVRNDDDNMYSIVALSPEYVNVTCVDIISIGNTNININNIQIKIKHMDTDHSISLYPSNPTDNSDSTDRSQFAGDNKNDFDEDDDLKWSNNNCDDTGMNINNMKFKNIPNCTPPFTPEFPNCNPSFIPELDTQTNNFRFFSNNNLILNNDNNYFRSNAMFDNTTFDNTSYGNNNGFIGNYTNNNNNNINNDRSSSPLTSTYKNEAPWKQKAKNIIESIDNDLNWDFQQKIIQFLLSYQKTNNNTTDSSQAFFSNNTPYKPEVFGINEPPYKRFKGR